MTPTAHWLEYLDHVGELLVEPVVVRDGHAVPPSRPGTGLEWNEDFVAHVLAVD